MLVYRARHEIPLASIQPESPLLGGHHLRAAGAGRDPHRHPAAVEKGKRLDPATDGEGAEWRAGGGVHKNSISLGGGAAGGNQILGRHHAAGHPAGQGSRQSACGQPLGNPVGPPQRRGPASGLPPLGPHRVVARREFFPRAGETRGLPALRAGAAGAVGDRDLSVCEAVPGEVGAEEVRGNHRHTLGLRISIIQHWSQSHFSAKPHHFGANPEELVLFPRQIKAAKVKA